MTNTVDRAKHRAPRRTPISGVALAAANPTVRRGALVASSSALVLTMVATTASAAPASFDVATPKARLTTLTDGALASLSLSPTVKVAADAEFSVPEVTASPGAGPAAEPGAVVGRSRAGSRTPTSYPPPPFVQAGGTYSAIALRYIGVPYVYGGTTPDGFDCSGFTQYVYAQVGISLPRTSDAQRYAGVVVPASQAQPGDLIWSPGHVGIYLGDGQHIAARQPGTPIYVSPIYVSNPVFIRPYGM